MVFRRPISKATINRAAETESFHSQKSKKEKDKIVVTDMEGKTMSIDIDYIYQIRNFARREGIYQEYWCDLLIKCETQLNQQSLLPPNN